MIELVKTISACEVRSYHLNLTDDHNRRLELLLLPIGHNPSFWMVKGRPTQCQERHNNQLWGTLRNRFIDNGIQPGDKVSMGFDPAR
jgi:hypothetical protein